MDGLIESDTALEYLGMPKGSRFRDGSVSRLDLQVVHHLQQKLLNEGFHPLLLWIRTGSPSPADGQDLAVPRAATSFRLDI